MKVIVEMLQLESSVMTGLDRSISYDVWSRSRTITVHALPHELDQKWLTNLLAGIVEEICSV